MLKSNCKILEKIGGRVGESVHKTCKNVLKHPPQYFFGNRIKSVLSTIRGKLKLCVLKIKMDFIDSVLGIFLQKTLFLLRG
jgi:hypothetical protein